MIATLLLLLLLCGGGVYLHRRHNCPVYCFQCCHRPCRDRGYVATSCYAVDHLPRRNSCMDAATIQFKSLRFQRETPNKLFSLDLLLKLNMHSRPERTRSSRRQPGAAMSSQEKPRSRQEQPGAARSRPGTARDSQGQPGAAREAENEHRARTRAP
jgi:hypothetical protein